jgi:predicted DNA-binding protein
LSVVCIRIPRELKERMDRLRDVIGWSEEIRKFIERKVEEIEQERALREFEEIIRTIPKLPPEEAVKLVKEDRNSY